MTKLQQRDYAYSVRDAQENKTKLSQNICDKFIAQIKYQDAQTVLWYLHCRSEVKTFDSVSALLQSSKKRIVIPYCTVDEYGDYKLGLWWLQGMAELTLGTWGILEPPKSRWEEKGKLILPKELDMVMVPGVAFDLEGGRLGNGAGYYDRLLKQVRQDTLLSAVCYESQIIDSVLMEQHDIYMDRLITEEHSYNFIKNGFKRI